MSFFNSSIYLFWCCSSYSNSFFYESIYETTLLNFNYSSWILLSKSYISIDFKLKIFIDLNLFRKKNLFIFVKLVIALPFLYYFFFFDNLVLLKLIIFFFSHLRVVINPLTLICVSLLTLFAVSVSFIDLTTHLFYSITLIIFYLFQNNPLYFHIFSCTYY